MDTLYRLRSNEEVLNVEAGCIAKESDNDEVDYLEAENETFNEMKTWNHLLGHLAASGLKNLKLLGILPISQNDMHKPLNSVRCAKWKAQIVDYNKGQRKLRSDK